VALQEIREPLREFLALFHVSNDDFAGLAHTVSRD
jgi:hypothetical protein